MTRKLFIAAALLATAITVHAQSLLDQTNTIVAPTAPSAVLEKFDVTVAGVHELTLTDLVVPAVLTGEKAAILRNGVVVLELELDVANSATATFEATPGKYSISLVGTPGAGGIGTIGARVRRGTDTPVLDLVEAIVAANPPSPASERTIDTTFEVTNAGNRRVTLSDLAFPQALHTAILSIVREGAQTPVALLSAAGSATFAVTPGSYRLFVDVDADPTARAGVFSVTVRDVATDATTFSEMFTVGKIEKSAPLALTAAAHSLVGTDLEFPAALASLKLAVIANGQIVGRLDAPGTTDFTATAGIHEIFYAAGAAPDSSGTLAVALKRGTATLADFTAGASDGAAAGAVTLTGSVGTPGTHRLRLTDFAFPQAFTTLRARITQGGAPVATLGAPGTVDVDLAVGTVTVLVSGIANTSVNGLYGVELRSVASTGAPVIEATRGVGSAFDAWPFIVTTAGRYQVFAEDLAFPERFAGLDAVITRGPDVIGSFFGGGSFIFSATPGTYFINFIARPSALSGGAGTYRMRVENAPSLPTVTLTADSSTVTTGGTTRLTWSSTNATACTASGAWSGNKAATGNETTVTLTTQSTFNIECSGPGGSSTTQLVVNVSAPAANGGGGGGGGGGALDEALLAGLFVALALNLGARRRIR